MNSTRTTVLDRARTKFRGDVGVRHGNVLVALYALLATLALYPIFSVTVPPLVDYPNHLARMHILASLDTASALSRSYAVNWKLHPNMAMELIVPFLARFMSIYMAGKVFIAAAMLMLLCGTMALRKTLHGTVGLWPAITFLLLFNHILFWGFLGYLFTAGLSLLAFSAWIALRERSPLLRAALFSVVTVVLYVGHLFGLLLYGLLILGYEMWRVRGYGLASRDMVAAWTVSGVQFAVPAVLFIHWAAGNGSAEPGLTEYGPLTARFAALISPVYMGLPAIDIPTAAFLALVFALCRASRSIGFAAPLKLPVLLLVAAVIAMPQNLSGVWGTHLRLPTMIACVLVAGVRLEPKSRLLPGAIACAAIALFCLRTAAITYEWRDLDGKFAEFRKASATMAEGARILVIEDRADLPAGKIELYGSQFWHMPALAVIDRSIFLPYLFTGHVGIRAADAVQHLDSWVGVPLSRTILRESADPKTSRFPLGYQLDRYFRVYWTGWPEHYDYVLVIRFSNHANPDTARLAPVHSGTFFDIYRVVRPEPDAAH